VCEVDGGGELPPPPPDPAQLDSPAIVTQSTTNANSLRRFRVASGSRSTPPANAIAFHPGVQGAGAARPDAWLVVICTVSVPVASAATLFVDGLKRHVAWVGRELHWKVNACGTPPNGDNATLKFAVCPLATVSLPAPVAAAVKSNPVPDNGAVAFAANALEAMANVPVCSPVPAGAKAMLAVQLAPAASDVPHVLLLSLKPLLAVSPRLSKGTVVLVFEIVRVVAALTAPTPVAGKLTCAGKI
jgi:hypothetical protein